MSALVLAVVAAAIVVLAGHRGAPSAVARRATPVRVRAVPAGALHVGPGSAALLSAYGSLWVARYGYVTRLDPATGQIETQISVPTETVGSAQLAAGAGSVWAAYTGPSTLLRIDPKTNRLVAKIGLGGASDGGGVAFMNGLVWVAQVTSGQDGDVVAIDPQSNHIVGSPVSVGTGPANLAAGLGSLWVQNTSWPHANVSRVDPRTRTSTFLPVAGQPSIGFGSLWIASGDHGSSVQRFDPATGHITATIRAPRAIDVAFGSGRAWILTYPRSRSSSVFHPIKRTATLAEVDTRTNQTVGRPIHLQQAQPMSVAVADNDLWIATYDGPLLHFKLRS